MSHIRKHYFKVWCISFECPEPLKSKLNLNCGRVKMEGNSQTEVNNRWQEKNKEGAKYISAQSSARSFIKNYALEEDLDEIMELILERKQVLLEMKIDQDGM